MLAPEAAIRLAADRAALMDRVAPPNSGMLALRGLPLDEIRRLAARTGVEIAIENGPDHAILGGLNGSLAAAEAAALQAGAKTVRRLPVSIASHTSLLVEAAAPFARMLAAGLARNPEAQFISGQSAEPLWTRDAVAASLARQLHSPLRFADALTMACECGATAFLEIGPGHGLTQIVSDLLPDMPARALEAFRSAAGAGAWIKRYA
jgi:[acyl-carrier-protein] S-malonyltransferase